MNFLEYFEWFGKVCGKTCVNLANEISSYLNTENVYLWEMLRIFEELLGIMLRFCHKIKNKLKALVLNYYLKALWCRVDYLINILQNTLTKKLQFLNLYLKALIFKSFLKLLLKIFAGCLIEIF